MENKLNNEFRTLMRNHRILVQDYLNKLNLYKGQPRILFVLEKSPEISQQKLSEVLNISKEATSVSIRRLEKTGFIERRECSRDRRIKLLSLSDHGQKIVKELRLNFDKIDSYMFFDLEADEQKELERLLLKMNKSLEKRLEDEKIV
ncbi:MAG TPA: MarR family transcriptional regulator [Erysipelotrichaceae bacterium]|nr:MarR family transcriptional regulator [Erysipelotrichaceae bacterium]